MSVLAEPGGKLEAGHLGQGRSTGRITCCTAAHGAYVPWVQDQAALSIWHFRGALSSLAQVFRNGLLFS